jgi:aspartyl-tRNA(Asn)/glutamyl-tRNA(Gln) amidotransferase subunit A
VVDLPSLSLTEIVSKVTSREVTASEVTVAYLARVEKVDPSVGAYLLVDAGGARSAAKALDERIAKGEDVGPLAGAPLAIKDIFATAGVKTTCASKMLAGYVPPYDATVVKKLRAAGAIVLGKTNMDEFAMGSSTENSAFQQTRNPWDLQRTPGGSSGGSAAAVAADLCAAATGTDTGGSIRQPAAASGVVGMKPTYGRVSRYGMIAFASSLDQGGPLAKTVKDAARLLEVMSGHDPLDSTSADRPVPKLEEAAGKGVKGLKIGVPKEYFGKGLDPEVESVVRASMDALAKAGATISEVSLKHTQYAVATYYLVATAEASSNLARYDGVRYGLRVDAPSLVEMYSKTRDAGFGAEVKRRILLGTYVLSAGYYEAYYKKAMQARTLIRRAYEDVLAGNDVILGPVAPTPAFKLGEKVSDPLAMYLSDIYTIAVNLAGLPGISVPGGFSQAGLPIGVQLVGRAWDEETVLRAAGAVESAMGVAGRRPAFRGAA